MANDGNTPIQVTVNVTLLNIREDVENDDYKATKLVHLVLNEVLSDASPARNVLANAISTREEIATIQNQVLRYLQPKDKYASLVSMLLKSRSFHLTHSIHGKDKPRIVVDLPRTDYKKPFIPLLHKKCSEHFGHSIVEENVFPISVSHQFPFVGIAAFSENINHGTSNSFLVGMDIVVFDEYNPRLYNNVDEFLDVFQDYFTEREWLIIQSQSANRLQEFYIRWAMKEAYTKALGLGMGAKFASIDLCLPGDVPGEEQTNGLYASMIGRESDIYVQRGTVVYLQDDTANEEWDFAFLALWGTEPLARPAGCACICAGPLNSLSSTSIQIHVDWMSFDSLLHWHQAWSR